MDYFPRIESAGTIRAQVFKSSADGGHKSMQLMYLLSIAAASHHVRLASAYFVPDEMTVQSLRDARRRGVNVQLIVPGPLIDAKAVRRASRARWGPMLAVGVEIYEYEPTMFHAFEDDLEHSKRITYEQWQARSWREKVLERLASLLGSQM